MQSASSLVKSETVVTPQQTLRKFLSKYIPVLSLILVVVVFSILAPDRFATLRNAQIILEQTAVLAIVAFGLTFVIIAGSIDLSVGSIVALAGIVAAGVSVTSGWFAGLAAGIIVGMLAGLFNGLVFTKAKIPSFIVTLGMLTIARGVTIIYSGGSPITMDPTLAMFGQFPYIFYLLIGIFLVCYILNNFTIFGRYVHAVGGDERVSALTGIKIDKVKTGVFVLSGILAGLGGVILAARMGAGTPTTGQGFELDVISAVVLGGTPLTGGIGNVWKTILGALIMAILANGMVIMGISSDIQMVIKGFVLMLAVLISIERSKIGIIK